MSMQFTACRSIRRMGRQEEEVLRAHRDIPDKAKPYLWKLYRCDVLWRFGQILST